MNPRQEYKKLINSFKYAIEGIISSFKTERRYNSFYCIFKTIY